jgi:hypothetical protein
MGDRTHLEQAEAVLAGSGAQLDLARARGILRGANGSYAVVRSSNFSSGS